jgi:hypothetical protein
MDFSPSSFEKLRLVDQAAILKPQNAPHFAVFLAVVV